LCSREGIILTVVDFLGDTKVGNLDTTLVVDENVGAFDVSVDDIPLVKVVKALKNLTNEVLD